jgi:intein/homing endonuclease
MCENCDPIESNTGVVVYSGPTLVICNGNTITNGETLTSVIAKIDNCIGVLQNQLDFTGLVENSSCIELTRTSLQTVLQSIINTESQFCTRLQTLDTQITNLQNQINNLNLSKSVTVTSCDSTRVTLTETSNSKTFKLQGLVPPNTILPYFGPTSHFSTSGLGLANTNMAGWAICVTGDTLVTLEDGSLMPIKEIVDNKLKVKVLSFNEKTFEIEPKEIEEFFKQEVKDKSIWKKITIKAGFKEKKSLNLTHNHPVLVRGRGWVEVDDLNTGDEMYFQKNILSKVGESALVGMYLSDGSVTDNRFRISQSDINKPFIDYVAKKYNKNINSYIGKSGFNKNKPISVSRIGISLTEDCPSFLRNFNKHTKITDYVLEKLNPISLAFAIMGDGHLNYDKRTSTNSERILLHTEGFHKNDLDRFSKKLTSLGYYHNIYKKAKRKPDSNSIYESEQNNSNIGYYLYFNKEGTENLAKDISPFIIPHFKYKLPKKYRNTEFVLDTLDFYENGFESYSIIKKEDINTSSSLFNIRYDIKVKDNHSFIANGYLVHNCNGQNGTINALNKFIKYSSSSDLTVLGNDEIELNKDNIPEIQFQVNANFNLSGTTNEAGRHTHKIRHAFNEGPLSNCPDFVQNSGDDPCCRNGSGVDPGTDCGGVQYGTIGYSGLHSHTFNAEAQGNFSSKLGCATPEKININPKHITAIPIQWVGFC